MCVEVRGVEEEERVRIWRSKGRGGGRGVGGVSGGVEKYRGGKRECRSEKHVGK